MMEQGDLHSTSSSKSSGPKDTTWTFNYYFANVAMGANFTCALTSWDLGDFVMSRGVFNLGQGILFTTATVASMLAGPLMVWLGPKKTTILSMSLMLLYFLGYAGAAMFEAGDPMQLPLFIIAALGCGFGIALQGAVKGPWTDQTINMLDVDDRGEAQTRLLANANIIAVSIELLASLSLYLLRDFAKLSSAGCIWIYAGLSLFTFAFLVPVRDPVAGMNQVRTLKEELRTACKHYMSPRAYLLAMLPLGVGCYAQWKTVNVTSELKKPGSIGQQRVGILQFVQSSSNLVFTKLFQKLSPCMGANQILALGCICMLSAPMLQMYLNLASDGWWILVFYIFGGMLWAMQSSTMEGVILDHFPGNQVAGAFAAYNSQTKLSTAAFSFMAFGLPAETANIVKEVSVLTFAGLAIPCLYAAEYLKGKESRC